MQTNFFAFGIPAETFQAQTLPYSHDALHRMRQQHNSEYSFFRYGDRIIASPHHPESPALGDYEIFEPTEHTVDRELIIGLGSSLHRSNAWQAAKQSRVVGLTTFFLGDGRYVLGENLPAVDYGGYFEKLLEHLDQSLTQLSDEYGWKEGENVRIVFHVFKPLKGIEIDVVDQLVKKFSKYNIIYAFVTVALDHPWMMYESIRSDRGKNRIQACDRGTNLVLDEYTCLLQLKGNKHRTNWKHRPPLPVKVRLHERSTYRDLQYISQQVLDFSYLSWRGFFPNELPVTIFYSQLMAKLTSKLEQVQGWNPVVIDRHFRRKKWFL